MTVGEIVPSVDHQLLLIEALSNEIAFRRKFISSLRRTVTFPRGPVAQLRRPLALLCCLGTNSGRAFVSGPVAAEVAIPIRRRLVVIRGLLIEVADSLVAVAQRLLVGGERLLGVRQSLIAIAPMLVPRDPQRFRVLVALLPDPLLPADHAGG